MSNPSCPAFIEKGQVVHVGGLSDDEVDLFRNGGLAKDIGFTAIKFGLYPRDNKLNQG